MEIEKYGPGLLVVLTEELQLGKQFEWPLGSFSLDGNHYHQEDFGNFTDFYDWLRARDGTLLGIRYWLREDLTFLGDIALRLRYASSDPKRQIEVYFSQRRDFDPLQSSSQEFLYSAVFRSDTGVYAIGFGAERLTPTDIVRLEASGLKQSSVEEQMPLQ